MVKRNRIQAVRVWTDNRGITTVCFERAGGWRSYAPRRLWLTVLNLWALDVANGRRSGLLRPFLGLGTGWVVELPSGDQEEGWRKELSGSSLSSLFA